jgi:hypothetical protein
MKNYVRVGGALLAAVCLTGTADAASWLNHQVTASYYADVGGGGFYLGSNVSKAPSSGTAALFTYTLYNNRFDVSTPRGGAGFGVLPFNGFRLTDDLASIAKVVLTGNTGGPTPSLSFDAHNIYVNFSGLTTSPAGQTFSYAVSYAPEPTSWAMMVGGFGLIGGALRRRHKVAIRFA